MIPPRPEPGLVLRYAFLWRHEAAAGRDEAVKDRPILVVVLLADGEEVVVAPITTKAPQEGEPAVEVPQAVRARLGLDAERCWISVAALNRFIWPGPDLRPAPGRRPASVAYGFVPQRLLDAVKSLALEQIAKKVPGLIVRRNVD